MKRDSHALLSRLRHARFWPILCLLGISSFSHSQSVIPDDEEVEDYTASGEEVFNVIPDTAKKLDAEGLHSAFSGVAHRGQYRFLRKTTGTFAFTETTHEDGSLLHVQGSEAIKGTWDVQEDQICYMYDRIWTYPVCFNIYKSGTCYYHLLRSSDGVPQYVVTARSTPTTQEPDCDALTS